MLYGKKMDAYRMTPNDLQQTFIDFFIEKYNYEPVVDVRLDISSWLPVEVEIEKEESDEFYEFYYELKRDLLSVPSKHGDENYELGDKLLQLLFGREIERYLFDEDVSDDEVYVEDEGEVYIFISNNPINYVDKIIVEKEFALFKKKIERFSYKSSDFDSFNSSFFTLDRFSFERESNSLFFSYRHNENENLHFMIDFHGEEKVENINFSVSGFFENREVIDDANKVIEQVKRFITSKPEHRVRAIFDDFFKITERIYHIPVKVTYLSALTPLESVVLSMYSHGYSYEEIGNRIGKAKKHIDNTIQRIRKKGRDGLLDDLVSFEKLMF